MLHSPCSAAVAGSSNRRCVPRPSAGAAPGSCVVVLDGAPTPRSSRPPVWPKRPTSRRRPHQPRSPVVAETGPTDGSVPTERRPGLERWRDALLPPTAVPGCPPRCGACDPLPSFQRRNLWAPFFRSFHRLAINDGRAGTGLATLSLPQGGVQRAVGPLPGAITTPGTEVVEDDAPGRQVMGEHSPGASSAQYIADGVDDLPTGIGDRPATRLGRRQQRFQQLPFSVA